MADITSAESLHPALEKFLREAKYQMSERDNLDNITSKRCPHQSP